MEVPRFTGGVYRASGMIRVGITKRRGRYDTAKQYGKPDKDVCFAPRQALETHPPPLSPQCWAGIIPTTDRAR